MLNKITTLRLPSVTTDDDVQSHIDAQNSEGWHLISVVDMGGWYRFFWAKEA